ncbi:MAG: heparan-alpha-glucosaminide N-acetyltransferase domain-containing protein [Alistipes sp.]|nr:heparan-alpha-glucosaminide N-acetyltransferase domain-containing protein [Alistipes sp.]
MDTTLQKQRLLALDVLRGLTIAGMILVNNPGSWASIYAPLRHAEWNGLTPTDLVFPFFMFIMGVSTYLSLRKYEFQWSREAVWKILRRTVVILLIGWGVGWFARFCSTFVALGDEPIGWGERIGRSCWTFERMRILGVLPRLALSYGAAALIALSLPHRRIPWVIASLLVGYTLLLTFGHGYEISEANLIGVVDRALWGPAHMYHEGDLSFDPEGLLSTLPSVAHVLIGFCCGAWVASSRPLNDKILRLLLLGVALTLGGWLMSYGWPINKKVWSSTFVLTTCGMGASLLGGLLWLIDGQGKKRWGRFFEVFGVNPLFLYVLASILSILMGSISLPHGDGSLSIHGWIYLVALKSWLGAHAASLAFALLFVGINWGIGWILYRHKIYIKI